MLVVVLSSALQPRMYSLTTYLGVVLKSGEAWKEFCFTLPHLLVATAAFCTLSLIIHTLVHVEFPATLYRMRPSLLLLFCNNGL